MMFSLFLVFALTLGSVLAADPVQDQHHDDDDDDCCSAEDRREIAYIWGRVWTSSFTDRKIAIAGAVFHDLFDHFPAAKAVYADVHADKEDSPEWRAFLVRFATELDIVINLFEDTQVLTEQLRHMAAVLVTRKGILKSHYDGLGDSFERVLPHVASCFNVDAWHRCFKKIVNAVTADLKDHVEHHD